MTRPLVVANCSGFYGDRLSALRELLEGTTPGPDGRPQQLDVITGDYLAELTMLILGRDTLKDASLGYARTFVRQVEDALGLALEQGVRIVANAGGVNPAGLAGRLREVATGLGLDVHVAHLEGDDLRASAAELGHPLALTANAYLGAAGIAAALDAGAQVVVTGRVTDASLVVGPAMHHHGWSLGEHDRLAGAVVAGHVLECGTQATGGNYSGFLTLPGVGRDEHGAPLPDPRPLGFPVAEVAEDGSSVITKQSGTGGAVTVDTVTAQLVYEIASPLYLGPDVTTDLGTVQLDQEGPDRVRVSGVRGYAPPSRLKVCVNELGGFRNGVELVVTGLHRTEKAAWVRAQVDAALARTGPPEQVLWSPLAPAVDDAPTEESASVVVRCSVLDHDAAKVGRDFTAAVVELALGSYPGFTLTAPPGKPAPYGIYRPAYVDRDRVHPVVVLGDGTRLDVPEPPEVDAAVVETSGQRPSPYPAPTDTLTRRVPLGTFVDARSGDKGGDANLGLWVRHEPGVDAEKHQARVVWLTKLVTPRKLVELMPEVDGLPVEVYPLPNLGGVNVVIRGLLGDGVAASTRFDPQAKALGEWVRSRLVSCEGSLL